MRKTILKTAFQAPLAYDRKSGFRTPQTSVIFDFLGNLGEKCEMVPMERLELSRCCHRGILNPLRLPFRHIGQFGGFSFLFQRRQRAKMNIDLTKAKNARKGMISSASEQYIDQPKRDRGK